MVQKVEQGKRSFFYDQVFLACITCYIQDFDLIKSCSWHHNFLRLKWNTVRVSDVRSCEEMTLECLGSLELNGW